MAVQKGKPGTKGQKQIVKENESTLQFYRNMALIASAIYLSVAYYFYNLFTFKQFSLISLSFGTHLGCYYFMAHMAKTQYGETGQLLDSGLDLNMEGGIGEHVKDFIILTSGCQILACISLYFWFLWLLAPGRAFWLLWVNFLGPYFMQSAAPEVPAEVNEKKQKKLERRMKRQQNNR